MFSYGDSGESLVKNVFIKFDRTWSQNYPIKCKQISKHIIYLKMLGANGSKWSFMVKNQVDRSVETKSSELEPKTKLVPAVPWQVDFGEQRKIEFSCDVPGGGGGI